ncbi:ATP-binding protein [Asticcacaulis sp.]|uniref:sensor histidine kinase n=1 Tax=Asticcacaulis sp. TaxID=1872648 RepID=UPI003F7CD13B
MTRRPLHVELLIGIGAPLALVIALIGVIAFVSARDEINEVYDSQLITSASELWLLSQSADNKVTVTGQGLAAADRAAFDDYARWRSFRVWRDGRLALASDNAALSVPLSEGFHTVMMEGGAWRVYTRVLPEGRGVVEVREKLRARDEVVRRVLYGLLLPLFLALPVSALVIWRGSRWGLRGLEHFASDVAQRSPGDLSPVSASGLPHDLMPLADALNALLAKLNLAAKQERLFTDNAAHELRTPLAALSLQAEVIAGARTAAERKQAVDALGKGINRVSRLLDQLLTLARVRQATDQDETCDVDRVLTDVITDVASLAAGKGMTIEVEGSGAGMIKCQPVLLFLMLRNLLDNAIKYAPPDSEIRIETAPALITLIDQGPGIPPQGRADAFRPFHRLDAAKPGSGLGLAIVRTIADSLAAEVELFTPSGSIGLGVHIRLP